MARRVAWTNNSSGHSGTYVYRAATLDPQNLPAPVATVDPVAQGATAEWIDNEELAAGDYDYAVQDFDGQGVGDLSSLAVYTKADPYASAVVGDEVGGGIYAGIITYADARQFHVIAAKAAAESATGVTWGPQSDTTGAVDPDDGLANQNTLLGLSNTYPAADHCADYSVDGYEDWYLPAKNELILVYDNLNGHPEFTDAGTVTNWKWSSVETAPSGAYTIRFSDNFRAGNNKEYSGASARPIRRVAV